MTPSQCRAARDLLGVTQRGLANLSGLGIQAISNFERSRRPISTERIGAMRRALEDAGVEFILEAGSGPSVRLRKGRAE